MRYREDAPTVDQPRLCPIAQVCEWAQAETSSGGNATTFTLDEAAPLAIS